MNILMLAAILAGLILGWVGCYLQTRAHVRKIKEQVRRIQASAPKIAADFAPADAGEVVYQVFHEKDELLTLTVDEVEGKKIRPFEVQVPTAVAYPRGVYTTMDAAMRQAHALEKIPTDQEAPNDWLWRAHDIMCCEVKAVLVKDLADKQPEPAEVPPERREWEVRKNG